MIECNGFLRKKYLSRDVNETNLSVLTQQAFPESLVLHFFLPVLQGWGPLLAHRDWLSISPLANIGTLGPGPHSD